MPKSSELFEKSIVESKHKEGSDETGGSEVSGVAGGYFDKAKDLIMSNKKMVMYGLLFAAVLIVIFWFVVPYINSLTQEDSDEEESEGSEDNDIDDLIEKINEKQNK